MKSRLPAWKIVVFSLIPALLLLGLIEGAARILWARYEAAAMAKDPNKVINFARVPDPQAAWRLAPNYDSGQGPYNVKIGRFDLNMTIYSHHNKDGWMQKQVVPVQRTPNSLRIVAIGESTTQGHNALLNYPNVLREMIEKQQQYPGGVEMINGGVSGYVSDQWAVLAERDFQKYKPDIVILYAGWNDIQTYNPHNPNAWTLSKSWYESAYSYLPGLSHHLKSVTIAAAALDRILPKTIAEAAPSAKIDLKEPLSANDVSILYKFYLTNVDRVIAAFRAANPDVKIVISTIVGRWPYESEAYFDNGNNSIWWMKDGKDDSRSAHEHLRRFNDMVRSYAQRKGIIVADSEKFFSGMERENLQWDFAHFTDEGYALLAKSVFDTLVANRVIKTASPTQ
jgi:lysophospholipase L1-like esterase